MNVVYCIFPTSCVQSLKLFFVVITNCRSDTKYQSNDRADRNRWFIRLNKLLFLCKSNNSKYINVFESFGKIYRQFFFNTCFLNFYRIIHRTIQTVWYEMGNPVTVSDNINSCRCMQSMYDMINNNEVFKIQMEIS